MIEPRRAVRDRGRPRGGLHCHKRNKSLQNGRISLICMDCQDNVGSMSWSTQGRLSIIGSANADSQTASGDITVWVKKFRLQKCWSQEQLAEVTGLSVRTIQRLEKGQPASMESLKALASVFEIDANDLQQEHAMNTQQSTPADLTADPAGVGSRRWITREEEQAIEHVEHVKGFYVHLLIFLVIMPALMALNFFISPHSLWFQYVLVPWLLAFALQAVLTFPVFKLFSPEWEKRQVEKRLGRKL